MKSSLDTKDDDITNSIEEITENKTQTIPMISFEKTHTSLTGDIMQHIKIFVVDKDSEKVKELFIFVKKEGKGV